MMRLITKILGQDQLAGRVASLHDRATALILPRCERCGFGTMRIFRGSDDMSAGVLQPGQTRLRCDRGDCGCTITVVSREVVRA